MDIIKMLVQSKQTDVNDRIQPMFEECVGYEKLSRSDKFRNFELPIMKKRFPILSELHTSMEWSMEQWKLGAILYETLVALGRINFFHGQTSLEQKLQSNKKNDRTMKAITAPVIKSIEEAKVDELIAGVTHDARHVLVSDNTIYVGYDDEESNATIVGTNVVLKGTTLYTITLIPDVWSHGLIIGTMDDQQIQLEGDNQVRIGGRIYTLSEPEEFLQQKVSRIVDTIHKRVTRGE